MTQAEFNIVKTFVSCKQEHVYGSVNYAFRGQAGTMLINNAPSDDGEVFAPTDYFITSLLQDITIEHIKYISLTTPTKTLTIKCL